MGHRVQLSESSGAVSCRQKILSLQYRGRRGDCVQDAEQLELDD